MFSSSRKFILPLFVYLSLFMVAAEAHDSLQRRHDHSNINMKRLMKKRAPLPQATADSSKGGGLLGGAVVGAAPVPSDTTSTSAPATSSAAKSTASPPASSSSASSAASSSAASSSAASSSSSTSSSASSSAASSSSIAPTTTLAPAAEPGVSTVVVGGITRTTKVTSSGTSVPDATGNLGVTTAKGITLTALIAVVASIGGVFIIWTIFRKWKLSSSKEFDRRLNPVDWQPDAEKDDGPIPGANRPRPPSITSSRSSPHGSAQGHNSNPFDDFDGPAKPSVPVGGYADLARGPSPNPQMQERFGAPAYYGAGAGPVPLHNQGY